MLCENGRLRFGEINMSFLNKINNSDRTQLHVILVGCGNVGTTLTKRLSDEGHYVPVIDKERCKHL